MLGHMLPDDNAWPHVARMTLQNLTDMEYQTFSTSPIFVLPLINRLRFFLASGHFFYPQKHSGVMFKAMDCGIVEREFVLQLRYYVHFRANTLGKVMNPLLLPAMG